MASHKNLTAANRHPPFRQVFANAAARTGDATVYPDAELYQLALQLDTMKLYVLTDVDPTTWTAVTDAT